MKLARYLLIIVIFSCAHKAPPISKDRMSPKLQKVASLDNQHIQFTFSEGLDTLTIKKENFKIFSEADTLKILTLYPSLSAAEIIVVSEKQLPVKYQATGIVSDQAENKGTFKTEFTGTTKLDTIPPRVISYPKGARSKELKLKFSEAMDTTTMIFHIIPKRAFMPHWLNYQTCNLSPKSITDSLHPDTTYYLRLKEARDIAGNKLKNFITNFTPDTSYKPILLRGKVMINDTVINYGLAILKREIPLGVAEVHQGEFAFEVRDSLFFTVIVVSDEYSGEKRFSSGKEDTIILHKEEIDIDSIIN